MRMCCCGRGGDDQHDNVTAVTIARQRYRLVINQAMIHLVELRHGRRIRGGTLYRR